MKQRIEQKWQQFGLWLFRGIMPMPPDPLMLLRERVKEAALQMGRCLGPAMREAAEAFKQFGEAVGEAAAEMEEARDAGED